MRFRATYEFEAENTDDAMRFAGLNGGMSASQSVAASRRNFKLVQLSEERSYFVPIEGNGLAPASTPLEVI